MAGRRPKLTDEQKVQEIESIRQTAESRGITLSDEWMNASLDVRIHILMLLIARLRF